MSDPSMQEIRIIELENQLEATKHHHERELMVLADRQRRDRNQIVELQNQLDDHRLVAQISDIDLRDVRLQADAVIDKMSKEIEDLKAELANAEATIDRRW